MLTLELTDAQRRRAAALHESSLVIDCSGVIRYDDRFLADVREGGITATNHTVTRPDDGLRRGLIAVIQCRRWVAANSGRVILATTAAHLRLAKDTRQYAVIMGPQNTDIIEGSLEALEVFYELGVRICQLTYQYRNLVGDGCGEPSDGGLSRLGRAVVREMNHLGMLIDLSHCGPRTTREAIEASRDPVIFSHTHPRALANSVRNKDDDLIRALAGRGGVMGITAFSPIAEIEPGHRPTVQDLVRHIEYVADLVGIDHVGIGLDHDETSTPDKFAAARTRYPEIYRDYYTFETRRVAGIDKISLMPNVTAAMVAWGFSDDDIRKVLGGNFLRVFEQVWRG